MQRRHGPLHKNSEAKSGFSAFIGVMSQHKKSLLGFLVIISAYTIAIQSQFSNAQESPRLSLQGRFWPGTNDAGDAFLPQAFGWTASSLFLSFEGLEGLVSVNINLTATAGVLPTPLALTWLRIFIDGLPVKDLFSSQENQQMNATIETSSGNHTLRLALLNDQAYGSVKVEQISLTNGRFLSPPTQPSERKLLILGDSYATGYGNIGNLQPNSCIPKSEADVPQNWQTACRNLSVPDSLGCKSYVQAFNGNPLEAWGPKLASAFNADFQLLATSGEGMVGFGFASVTYPDKDENYWEEVLPTNAMVLNRTSFPNISETYSLSDWVPEVVILASGSNDWTFAEEPLESLEDWVQQAADFIQEISEQFDRPTIIIQVWPTEQQEELYSKIGPQINQTLSYFQAMGSLYTEVLERDVPRVQYLQISTEGYDTLRTWCDRHPSVTSDNAIANQVAEFIQKVLPSWSPSNPIPSTFNKTAVLPDLQAYL